MFFSLIVPAAGNVSDAAYERLDGPYADHRWLWQWFPAPRGETRDFLFRRRDATCPTYYVVSKRQPLDRLGAWRSEVKPYQPQLGTGDRLRFELRANPTVRHAHGGKSRRHDVVMNAKKQLLPDSPSSARMQDLIRASCTGWLKRQEARAGFELDVGAVRAEGYRQHREPHGDEAEDLRFSSVDLSGELTVTDPASFLSMLHGGLGRAKAFGCGLMLVRRA